MPPLSTRRREMPSRQADEEAALRANLGLGA
jgi:hypothetical protein